MNADLVLGIIFIMILAEKRKNFPVVLLRRLMILNHVHWLLKRLDIMSLLLKL